MSTYKDGRGIATHHSYNGDSNGSLVDCGESGTSESSSGGGGGAEAGSGNGNHEGTTCPAVAALLGGGQTCYVYGHDDFGRLTSEERCNEKLTTYVYYDGEVGGSPTDLKSIIEDDGGLALTTSYTYDSVGNVLVRTDPRGNATTFVVNALNQVVRKIDPSPLSYQIDYFYDGNDNLARTDVQNVDEDLAVVTSNPHFTTIREFDALNNITRECKEAGAHDVSAAQLDCVSLPDAEFVVTQYGYDHNENLDIIEYGQANTATGTQAENLVRTIYDERDLIFRVVRAEGHPNQSSVQYDYDPNGNRSTITAGLEGTSRVIQQGFDGYDRLVTVTEMPLHAQDPNGTVTTYGYDGEDNLFSVRVDGEEIDGMSGTQELLAHITFEFDSWNRLDELHEQFFSAAGLIGDGFATQDFQYTSFSSPHLLRDDNGHDTVFGYDDADRLDQITDAKANITHVDLYDANGNPLTIREVDKSDTGQTDESFTTTNTYDALNRRTSTTDNAGNVHQYRYDSRSNLVLHTDARLNETRYVYDGLSRLMKTVRDMDSDGAEASTEPDPDPQTNDADIVTTQSWDDSSRLIAQTDDNGNTTRYAYDPLNRMVATRMADGTLHQVGSGLQPSDWPAGAAAPDLTNFTNGYDVHDKPLTVRDENGTVVTNAYDLLNRLIGRTIVPGPNVSTDTTQEIYKYDGHSRVVHAEDNDSVVTRGYDSLNHVVVETLSINGAAAKTVTTEYDGVGNLIYCQYPGGRKLDITPDALDRPSLIKDITTATRTLAAHRYIGPERIEQREFENNVWATFDFDNVRRITETKHQASLGTGALIDHRDYDWDPMFNKLQRRDLRAGVPQQQLVHDYVYDAANRLTDTTVTDAVPAVRRQTEYRLDGVHNRTEVLGNPDPGLYVMDPADRPMNQYTTTPFDGREDDPNGNLIVRLAGGNPIAGMVYDYRNQMVEYYDAVNEKTHTYAYDTFGRRIAKVIDLGGQGTTETRYFYGGPEQWQVLEEQDAAGATLATYVYSGLYIDDVVSMHRGGEDYFYHADDLHNVMAVTTGGGSVAERYEYGDYGQPLNPATLQPLGASLIANPYLFTGRRYDQETGLYYYRTRYLDPFAGRFTTRDTIGIWGDPGALGSGVSYASCRPTSSWDPFGLADDWGPLRGRPGFNDFRRWFHKQYKQKIPGAPDATPEELDDAWEIWDALGRPNAEGHRPRPRPEAPNEFSCINPRGSRPETQVDMDGLRTAGVVAATTVIVIGGVAIVVVTVGAAAPAVGAAAVGGAGGGAVAGGGTAGGWAAGGLILAF